LGRFVWIAFAGMLLQFPSAAALQGDGAQTAGTDKPPASVSNVADDSTPASDSASADNPSGPSDSTPANGAVRLTAPDYAPMTFSERARKYIVGAFGPGAIVRAAAGAGIAQWKVTPKEWRVGPEAYGDRFGSIYATHVIREALEFGGSLALREDNRYFRSTDSGFFKRTKHAVTSVFVARNEAGGEHFAYSRFVAVAGSSFISRLWQPPSDDSGGDGAVNFGVTMAADIGWNFFHEFCPRSLTKHFKVH